MFVLLAVEFLKIPWWLLSIKDPDVLFLHEGWSVSDNCGWTFVGNVQEASRLLGSKDVRVNCLDEVREISVIMHFNKKV